MILLYFFVYVKEVSDNNGGLSSVVDNLFFLFGFDFFDLQWLYVKGQMVVVCLNIQVF